MDNVDIIEEMRRLEARLDTMEVGRQQYSKARNVSNPKK